MASSVPLLGMVTPLHSARLDLLVLSNSLRGLQKFSPGARCKSDLLAHPTLSMVLVLLALSSTSSTGRHGTHHALLRGWEVTLSDTLPHPSVLTP